MKQAVLYSRVSSEEQARGNAVSLDEQRADMQALCERNGWQIQAEFVDCENYKATQAPKRGKIVNPSGERADRPQFLEMLDLVRAGGVDIVLCWRADRLMRHPRVAVALEDALDLGDARRNGTGKVDLYEATGSNIDRTMMHIQAVMWREENRRRTERMKMAKIGTLKANYWPGSYNRYGYTTRREYDAEGRPLHRGRIIELGDPAEVETVKKIYDWYDSGGTLTSVRRKLLAIGAEQKGNPRIHEWNTTVINDILRREDYIGKATWNFKDGGRSIEIPEIVSREQWERVQKRLDNAQRLSKRNAHRVYLLQHIARCGECGGKIGATYKRVNYYTRPNGERVRYKIDPPQFRYRCCIAMKYNDEDHPRPYSFKGHELEWDIWRYIVDNGIKRPELIREQVETRQKSLIAEGDSVDGEIAHVRQKLDSIGSKRAFYQRKAAEGRMDETEFDQRMDETEESRIYWRDELARLLELRDDADKVREGLDYAAELLNTIKGILPEIEKAPDELQALPEEEQREILLARQKIVRALVDTVHIYADGRVKIEGLIDGSEATRFASGSPQSQYQTLRNKVLPRPAL